MKAPAFAWEKPSAVDAAVALVRQGGGDAKFVAGSQSLGPMLNLRLAQPAMLVEVRGLAALREVTASADAVTYGAGITHAAFEDRKVPDATGGFLHRVAAGIAYRAVRNRGTLGGSLCHADPAADWVNALAVLDGVAIAAGPGGTREIALRDFVTGIFSTALADDELLVAVRIRRSTPGARFGYWKFCRKPGEFSEATGVVHVDVARGIRRIALGALDRAPLVVDDDGAIVDRLDPAAIERVLDAADLVDDVYDRQLHRVALERAVKQTQSGASA